MSNRDRIIEDLRYLDEEACTDRLTLLGRAGLTDAGKNQALHHLAAMANAGQALRDTVAADLKPNVVLHETFRENLGVYRAYGPAAGGEGNLRWGQGTKAKPERAGTYRREHLRIEDGLHFDLQPDREGLTNPAGRPCFETGFIATRIPLFSEIATVTRWQTATGFWPCPFWVTAADGGWSVLEIDGPEDFGVPATKWEHGRHSLATHIGFDGMTNPPFINAQPNLLNQGHWHLNPADDDLHAFGLRIEPEDGDALHLVLTWTRDGKVTQQLRTLDFEALVPPRTMTTTLQRARAGLNLYHCTQVSKVDQPKPGLVMPSAMLIDEVLVTTTAA